MKYPSGRNLPVNDRPGSSYIIQLHFIFQHSVHLDDIFLDWFFILLTGRSSGLALIHGSPDRWEFLTKAIIRI